MDTFVRRQLIALAIISVVAVGTVLFHYAKLPTLLGIGQQTVTARFADGANLYPNANVTYRGYTIGKVEDIVFPPPGQRGIDVVMSMDDDRNIPVDSITSIKSVSAIGEQFVDFEPRTPEGPFLADGDAVPLERTKIPTQIAPVLTNLQALLDSVPTESLQTVIREFGTGFDGAGPKLRRVLDSVSTLVDTADKNYGPTRRLIQDAGPVLQSQIDASPEIREWTRNLALFTDTLRNRDQEIRRIVDRVPPAAQALTETIRGLRPTLPVLLNNLTTVGDVLAQYNPTLEQVLVIYPKLTAIEQRSAGDGLGKQIGLDLRTQVERPRSCYPGYAAPGQPLGPRGPSDLRDAPTKPNSFCKVPQDDDRVVRGARNALCLEGPEGRRAPTPAECRNGRLPESVGVGVPDGAPNPPLPVTTAQTGNATIDDVTPDDPLFVVGGIGDSSGQGKDATWQRLLLAPTAM